MGKLLIGLVIGVIVLLFAGIVAVDRMQNSPQVQQPSVVNSTLPQQNTAPVSPTPVGQGGSVDAKVVQLQVGDRAVTIDKNGFHPQVLTMAHGSKVTWSNTSDKPVKIMSAPIGSNPDFPALNIGVIEPGKEASITFPNEGSFGYKNANNPSQTGAVIAL